MSIKSQEGHMRQLALLLTTDLGCIFGERESGPNGSKKAFLNVGKVFLRALAKDLGLHEVTVSANSGGIAVSGTCSLYGMGEDGGIAVWIEQRLYADGKVLCYRTIRSSRDFKGGYGGRRYDRLSLSEKIRAGMEVSELMKRLTGRNYPVFVDNMESVDDLANVRPTGQIIMAKCVSGAALQVKPVRPIVFAEQRAA